MFDSIILPRTTNYIEHKYIVYLTRPIPVHYRSIELNFELIVGRDTSLKTNSRATLMSIEKSYKKNQTAMSTKQTMNYHIQMAQMHEGPNGVIEV